MLYAPAPARPALFALFGLDLELAHVVATTTEPMLGEIRLAWWRDALTALDTGPPPAQPLLQALAAHVLPRGITGTELAALEERWLGLIGTDDVPDAHITGGGHLFALAARLLDGDPALGDKLGQAWATGLGATGQGPDLPRTPTALRPLLGLVRLATRDAARTRAATPLEPRGSTARQLRLLGAIAFGR